MKVLFVASGNKVAGQVNSFVRSQYDSLQTAGLEMSLFPVVGHGVWGYLSNIKALRYLIKTEKPDIIHAHYSTCGFLTTLAIIGLKHKFHKAGIKVVVSILGSFPQKNIRYKVIRWFLLHVWDGALVKSERTRQQLDLPLPVIPNGVNMTIFRPQNYDISRAQVGFNANKKYIVWCSDPKRPEKNWALAEYAIQLLKEHIRDTIANDSVELVAVYNKTPKEVALYMNAADCVLMTSDNEGSPNVIKEAMACARPIVTTNVGDVCERLTGVDYAYYTTASIWEQPFESLAQELADGLFNALKCIGNTNGVEAIMTQELSIEKVGERIIALYEKVLNK